MYKTREILDTQHKYYFIDQIFTLNSHPTQKFENLIFTQLTRDFGAQYIYFARDDKGREVDFVVYRDENLALAVQVCYQLTDENLSREVSSLELLRKYSSNKETSYILIYSTLAADVRKIPDFIQLISVSKFLLQH